MISDDSVASAAERRRERVVGSEKKASQEGESKGRVRRTSDSDSAVIDESLRSLDRRLDLFDEGRVVPRAESDSPRMRSPWLESEVKRSCYTPPRAGA